MPPCPECRGVERTEDGCELTALEQRRVNLALICASDDLRRAFRVYGAAFGEVTRDEFSSAE